jgi:hypothetical protein
MGVRREQRWRITRIGGCYDRWRWLYPTRPCVRLRATDRTQSQSARLVYGHHRFSISEIESSHHHCLFHHGDDQLDIAHLQMHLAIPFFRPINAAAHRRVAFHDPVHRSSHPGDGFSTEAIVFSISLMTSAIRDNLFAFRS